MLVSGATRTVARYRDSPHIGVLLTPAAGNRVDFAMEHNLPWACDNSAYSCWDERQFRRMLGAVAGRPGCMWIACPDVVGDAAATMELFDRWEPVVRATGQPVALVLQDGQERLEVPWTRIDAVFVGGTDSWKLGEYARSLVEEARRQWLQAHLGRCNSRERIRLAARWGCCSFDGSGWSRWPDQRIPKGLRWIEETVNEPVAR